MLFRQITSPILSLLVTIAIGRPAIASLIPDLLHSLENLQDVHKRCDNPCGYYGQLCCQSDEVCYTDANNQAQCGTGSAVASAVVTQQAAGSWEYYTTTYVQTDLQTVTATFSSYVAETTLSCSYSLGETPCGNVCCLSGQYCQSSGSCVAVGGGSSGYYSNLYTVTTTITNTASVPLRPTSNGLTTVTSTGIATTTQPFITPVGTDGSIITPSASTSSGGLSGGAIAGIVIGVILGIIILLLICACCCFKGLLDGLLAIFGLGPRRRRRTEEVEVYESHHHSGSRPGRRTWFGTRPGRDEVVEEKSGWGRGAGVAAFLGGLALVLGLKRRHDRKDKNSTGYGSSYYSGYTSSSSESSSDRRTRRSSRSRSRVSRR